MNKWIHQFLAIFGKTFWAFKARTYLYVFLLCAIRYTQISSNSMQKGWVGIFCSFELLDQFQSLENEKKEDPQHHFNAINKYWSLKHPFRVSGLPFPSCTVKMCMCVKTESSTCGQIMWARYYAIFFSKSTRFQIDWRYVLNEIGFSWPLQIHAEVSLWFPWLSVLESHCCNSGLLMHFVLFKNLNPMYFMGSHILTNFIQSIRSGSKIKSEPWTLKLAPTPFNFKQLILT